MKRSTQFVWVKRVAFLSLLGAAIILAGCQSKTPEVTAQKTKKPTPKTAEPEPEPKTESPEPEPKKTEAPKVSAKVENELPPVAPTTEELALEELKKRGGKAELNKNGNVDKVTWTGPEVTDNDLVILQRFEFLDTLDLTETSITDAGLKHIRDLRYLRYVYLLGTGITDAGVTELQGHSRLERLCLDGTKVTDKGVKFLEPLDRLVMLHLATQGEITDASIETLINLPELREIKLEGTKITEDGKARLVKAKPDIQFIGEAEEGAIPID